MLAFTIIRATNHPSAASGAAKSGGYSDDLLSMSMFASASGHIGQQHIVRRVRICSRVRATSGSYLSDLLALSIGSSSLPQVATASNEGGGGGKVAQSTGQQHPTSAGSYKASELKFAAS